jgi:hypothetical protein
VRFPRPPGRYQRRVRQPGHGERDRPGAEPDPHHPQPRDPGRALGPGPGGGFRLGRRQDRIRRGAGSGMSCPAVRASSARWASVAAGRSAERSGVNRCPGCRRRNSASAVTARWRWTRVAASQSARSATTRLNMVIPPWVVIFKIRTHWSHLQRKHFARRSEELWSYPLFWAKRQDLPG